MNLNNKANNKRYYNCVIYTRKSHEEGLEQEFNSLDAQRESGEAYIKSQAHENWKLLPKYYDDGGYSGGTLERPALNELLDDIKQNKIDIIVVYKVDRLSRSLGDFAKLMDLFDKHKVSFVSVTQQFNTTSSMGRLTLNVLLSFAQFEREVTGERIRDKIALSKQKGKWMGGVPPLGYRVVEHKLKIIEDEAKTVKLIFELYTGGKTNLQTSQHLNHQGTTTKSWVSKTGIKHNGTTWSPKQIYRVLANPLYIGKIKHKDKLYDGEHKPIIEQNIWDKVQSTINKQNTLDCLTKQQKHFFALKGLIRTKDDFALSPSTNKNIRYYVSQKAIKYGYGKCKIKNINAKLLEEVIFIYILDNLSAQLKQHLINMDHQYSAQCWLAIRKLINMMTISPNNLWIELNNHEVKTLADKLEKQEFVSESRQQKQESTYNQNTVDAFKPIYQAKIQNTNSVLIIKVDINIKRHDGRRYILSKDGKSLINNSLNNDNELSSNNSQILGAIAQSYSWKDELNQNNLTINELADKVGKHYNFVYKRFQLLSLSPTILKQITSNTLSPLISLKNLYEAGKYLSWDKQHQYLDI
jgi:DNA invertase Pin-like site-specific DNA recombinase